MKHLDLFSGIGGFALAVDAVWPDAEHFFCENDPFCQVVLHKHWPKSKIYEDIRTLTNTGSVESRGVSGNGKKKVFAPWSGGEVDLITGGFPCQPFSHAGKRKGITDDRYLWPEMRRVIQEFSPSWVVGENVRGLLSIDGGLVFESMCLDLEALGYEVQPFVIPACAVDAPHRRDRIWIIARNTKYDGHTASKGRKGDGERTCKPSGTKEMDQPPGSALAWDNVTDTEQIRHYRQDPEVNSRELQKEHKIRNNVRDTQPTSNYGWSECWPTIATRLCTLDDGLQDNMVRSGGRRDTEIRPRPKGWRNAALKAAGNAIVPQVAMEILQAIKNTTI